MTKTSNNLKKYMERYFMKIIISDIFLSKTFFSKLNMKYSLANGKSNFSLNEHKMHFKNVTAHL